MKIIWSLLVASAAFFYASAAPAQNSGTVPNNAIPIGTGTSSGGFRSVSPGDGQLVVGQPSGDPQAKTITGDVTFTAAGVASVVKTATSVKTANYTLATTDCGSTVQYGTGSTGLITATLPAASGFAEGCRITVFNGDAWATGRGKILSGFPTGFTNGQLILWPTQSGVVQRVNGAWATVVRPGRPKLPSGTVNFYANFTLGSDTAGVTDGMATGASAFKSIQTAMFMSCQEFDLSAIPQTQYTVNVAAATNDTQGVHYACHGATGAQGGAAIYVSGGANSTINVTNVDAFAIDTNAIVSVNSITFQAGGNVTTASSTRPADCVRADYGGRIFLLTNTFVVCAGTSIAADQGGNVYLFSPYTINSGGQRFLYAQNGGVITTGSTTSGFVGGTYIANVSFTDAFARAGSGGTINVPAMTFSLGAFTSTGTRTKTDGTGSINTSVLGASATAACNNTFFPGTVNGAVASPYCN
jgi:hypothetical protein